LHLFPDLIARLSGSLDVEQVQELGLEELENRILSLIAVFIFRLLGERAAIPQDDIQAYI